MKHLAVIGLGTMGANLARNAARSGVHTHVYNRTTSKAEQFVKEYSNEGTLELAVTYEELLQQLPEPRVILVMVKAGPALDAIFKDVLPLLSKGDSIIDGGNSNFTDTNRRCSELGAAGIHFVGLGISGGEEGALAGPSMMPGCSKQAWEAISEIFVPMAADDAKDGKCIAHLGEGGAGHFVKMVHNGIEYGIMQLLAESYDILKNLGNYSNTQLAETFAAWNDSSVLGSFLVEITAEIFTKEDPEDDGDLVDKIKDTAAQKGTGKWTSQYALDYGVAVPTITAAVNARIISGSTHLRESYKQYPHCIDEHESIPAQNQLASMLRNAVKQSVLLTYLQGFELISEASKEEGWNINLAEVARIWEGGCIIRSEALPLFKKLYTKGQSQVARELIMGRFELQRQMDFRRIIEIAVSRGTPVPAMSASLSYFDALQQNKLPQNLIQAQRDFFGAHTFERTDKKGSFHADWNAGS